jgi:methyltransferase (TIGR00027 family)
VILGAGFDTRAYRLAHKDTRVWEVDVPTTQRKKRSMLAAAGIDTSHVTFVPVNFEVQDAMDELRRAGLDLTADTLIIWEGSCASRCGVP